VSALIQARRRCSHADSITVSHRPRQ
jgi:hypothetical protein